jgi:hypothetical protein
MPKQHTIEFKDCASAALKYSSRSDFARGSQREYQALWRRGLLEEACAHMTTSPIYSSVRWTPEGVFKEAAKYRNRAEFKRECSGAHGYALTNGLLDQACAHMRNGHNFWHVFELMAVAVKYTDKSAFIRNENSAYEFCVRHGLVDLICARMDQRRSWDKPSVLAAAAECTSRGGFQALYGGAYKQADAGGYLDEACAHMLPPEYGFSKEKPAVLYHLRITGPNGLKLFKVGITNRDPAARIAGMGLHPGFNAELLAKIEFPSGRDARIVEKRLHRKFSSHRYGGLRVMKNGNTELFTVNVLDLQAGDI